MEIMIQSDGITLLVEDDDQLAQFYQLNLKVWVGAKVRRASSIKELETFLQKNKNVSLIVTRSAYSSIARDYIEADNLRDIAHIHVGQEPIADSIHVENGLDIQSLVKAAAKALSVTAADMAKLKVPDYFPIDIECFHYVDSPVCDVFAVDSGKYKLQFAQDEELSKTKLAALIKAGHDSLYVLKNNRLKTVANISQEVVSKVGPSALNENENLTANEMGQKLLQHKLAKIGITEETTELARKNLANMVRSAKSHPRMSRLLERLMSNKAGYLYTHSQLLMYVCDHLMNHIDWCNEEQKKTINFVAFFHDIALTSDEQAMIHSEEQLKRSNLGEKEKELVKRHAQIAAELVQRFPQTPMGADAIIRQHHGIAHGVGFSEHYGGNLSPMTIVFILAEDFTDHVI